MYHFEIGPHLLVGIVIVALIMATAYVASFKNEDDK